MAVSISDTRRLETSSITFPRRPVPRIFPYPDEDRTGIRLVKEALMSESNVGRQHRRFSKIVFFQYRNLHQILDGAEKNIRGRVDGDRWIVNSRVVSASLAKGKHVQLGEPVDVTLEHLVPDEDPVCVFWDLEESSWSDVGCQVNECKYDHLCKFLQGLFYVCFRLLRQEAASLVVVVITWPASLSSLGIQVHLCPPLLPLPLLQRQ